jgi:hypothetical protein
VLTVEPLVVFVILEQPLLIQEKVETLLLIIQSKMEKLAVQE